MSLGKAKSLKSKMVYGYYENFGTSNSRWVELGEALNGELQNLGDAEIIQVQFKSIPHGEGELHEVALIIYKED